MLAGGNGAGKSTFYHHYLAKYGIKFGNADLIARAMSSELPERLSYQARVLQRTLEGGHDVPAE